MIYFFESEEKVQALRKELDSWVGTPHRHRCMVKHKGVDCINLVRAAYTAVGVPYNDRDYPEYSKSYHFHNSKEVLSVEVPRRVNCVRIKSRVFMDGDILLYRFGKISSHASVYYGGYIYHSVTGKVVTKIRVNDRLWYPRLTFIFRVLK